MEALKSSSVFGLHILYLCFLFYLIECQWYHAHCWDFVSSPGTELQVLSWRDWGYISPKPNLKCKADLGSESEGKNLPIPGLPLWLAILLQTISPSVCTSQWVELSLSLSPESKPYLIITWEVCSSGEGAELYVMVFLIIVSIMRVLFINSDHDLFLGWLVVKWFPYITLRWRAKQNKSVKATRAQCSPP